MFLYIIVIISSIFAQNSSDKEYNINQEVVVTGQRTPFSSNNSIISLEIIDSKEIENLGIQSVSDILEISSGIDVRNRGKSGMQSDISLRGGSFNQTLILVDGIPVNDPQTGHHNMNLTITPDMIERIEIIKSGSSKSLGINAFTGAINIITKNIKSNNIMLNLEGGDFRYKNAEITLSNKFNKFSNLISLSTNSSNGFRPNTDHNYLNIASKSNYNFNSFNKIALNLSYSDRQFGAFNFYTPSYPNQYGQTKTLNASLIGEFGDTVRFSPSAFYRTNYDRFELFRDFKNAASWYSDHNYHLSTIIATNGNLSFSSIIGKSSIGYEIRNENILSTVLGEKLSNNISNPIDTTKFTKGKNRLNSTIFVENQYESDNFLLNIGSSFFHNTDYGTYVNPGIDLGYRNENYKIYTKYNRSIRIPTFTELYYSGPTNIGNPDLKAEISDNFEVGSTYNKNKIQFNLSLFMRNGRNLIDWNRENDSLIWKTNNLTNIIFYGIESALSINDIFESANFTLSNIKLSGIFLKSDKEKSNVDSYYVLDHLNYKLNLLLSFKVLNSINVLYDISLQKRNGDFQQFTSGGFVLSEYKQILLSNLKINYNLKSFNLYLNITNLFNEKYYDIANVPLAGRWASLGVKYNLNY